MSFPRCLGNDVVDLHHPRLEGKGRRQDRFAARVFDPQEKDAWVAESDPETGLWLYWAAKEAVFKSVSKAMGSPPPFRHALFRVRLDPPSEERSRGQATPEHPPEGRLPAETSAPRGAALDRAGSHPGRPWVGTSIRKGIGSYGDFRVNLWIELGAGWIHALSWIGGPPNELPPRLRYGVAPLVPPPGDWKESLRLRFSPREWEVLYHAGSALARLEARAALAASLGLEERRLEIVAAPGRPGRRIPRVLLDGEETPLDLTLSHHGSWVAWAFFVGDETGGGGFVLPPFIPPKGGT